MTGRRGLGLIGGRARPHLLALEPRMMFDAAMAATGEAVADRASAGDAAHSTDAEPHHAEPHHVEPRDAEARDATLPERHDPAMVEAAPAEPRPSAREIVFIDTAVADYRQLADAWAGRGDVVLIDSRADGIDQVRAALAGRSDVAAIHIVSHGAEGVLFLGTTRIDANSINGDLAASLGAIGRSLTEDGDILLYGCEFAEGIDGARALERFAAATGADVAASTDLTGATSRGGDWDLEAHRGLIEAAGLDGGGWDHLLAENKIVPISVTADSLTVTRPNGTVAATGTTGYTNNRAEGLGVGTVARWTGAATLDDGTKLDLVARVISLSNGDTVQFVRPGTGLNPDDASFLLVDGQATNNNDGNGAVTEIRWTLVRTGTDEALPANVQFTIGDIDGVDGSTGNRITREGVSTSTDNLAYYTYERTTDIRFTNDGSRVTAIGTRNENTDTTATKVDPKSAATFDWTKVSAWSMTYTLASPNGAARQAQFYHDGNAQLVKDYVDPVYVSIPRLDLDGDDSTATGNDAHFTFTENGAGVSIVDTDIRVVNPMPDTGIVSGKVTLTNYKDGDTFIIGTLPGNITATIGAQSTGTLTVTLSGTGTEADYAQAFRAITFRNASDAPDTTQRVIQVSFTNASDLTSPVASSRIDVIATEDAPVARPDEVTTREDMPVTVDVVANDTDADGDPLTVTAASALHGTVTFTGGSVRYTPNANYFGTDTISYTISDGHGGTASSTVAVTVTAVNDAPTRVGALPARTAADTDTVSYATAGAFTDVDGDQLTYSATGLPAGLTIDAATGVITGTLGRSASRGGGYDIVVTARDPSRASTTQGFRLTVTNPPPTATDDSVTTAEDTPVSLDVRTNDGDPDGDPLTVTAATASHGSVAINGDGTITYTPDADYNGPDTIRYTIADGDGGTAQAEVAVTVTPVDDAPRAKAIPHDYAAPDGAVIRVPAAGAFTNPDGDALTYAATGLPAGLSIDPGTGTIAGTIDRSASQVNGGVYAIRITATDPGGKSAVQDITLTVTNPPPVAADHRVTTAEETAVTVAVLDTDSDPDNDLPLTVSNPRAANGTALVNPDGSITYTPDRDFFGTDVVTYTLTDADGGTSEGRITVTVTDVEDAPVAQDDTLAATEDTPVTFDPRVNDRDPDRDPLSVTRAVADRGTVAINPDGTLTYTPDADYNGADTIRYTVADGRGGTADAVVAVTVAAVNDAPRPVGTPPVLTGRDGAPARYVTASYFTDVEGDALTYSATGLPPGLTIDAATGEITGTPGRSASQVNGGRYDMIVTASDGRASTSRTFVLTIANPAPTATDDAVRTAEDTAVTLDPRVNDRDPDGDPLSIVSAIAGHGRVAINPDGTITYTPDADFHGDDLIRYTVSDGQGGTADAVVRVTVDPVDDAPVAQPIPTRYALVDGQTVSGIAANAFRDPDGDALLYTATGLPAGLTIDPATGIVSGTLDRSASQGAPYAVRIVATDPSGQSATQDLIFEVTDPAPVAADDRATVVEDTPTVLRPLDNDSDPDGDPLSIVAAVAGHGTVAINADGTITYTPDADFHGDDVVRYTVSDGQGGTADAIVRVSVTPANDVPDATALPARTDPSATAVSVSVAGAFADRDGDPLTFGANGLPPGLSIDPATGVVSGTIAPGAAYGGAAGDGRYAVTVTATDPSGATAATGFTWTIDPVAPVARDDAYATPEDTAITLPVLANDTDGDGDALTIVAATATNGVVAIDGGRLVFTPARDFTGTAVVSYTIADPAGNRATATAMVTVTAVNDAPAATPIPATTARDAQSVTLDLGGYFSDADGETLRFSATGLPPGLRIDPVTGRITGTLPADASRGATYAVVVTATDPSGDAASGAFAWTIVNPAPTAIGDRATTAEDRSVTIPVLANDFDPDGDALAPVAASALHGTVAIEPDGTLTYTPDADFNGQDVVTYTVADTDGSRATATVLVTVTPTPDAPVAVGPAPAPASVVERQAVDVAAAPLFADADGDPLRYAATGLPPGLAIDPATGRITGTIAAGARDMNGGVYRSVVTATDPAGASASTVVEFRVLDRPPTLTGDPAALSRTVPEGQSLTIDAAPLFGDPDGDRLTFAATGLPPGLTIDPAAGAITGSPARGAGAASPGGRYPVTITASDGRGGSATATITLTIVNQPPVAADDSANVAEDGAVTIPVLANDRDQGGDPLRVVAATAGSGSVTINPDGTITYRPGANFAGSDLIRYMIADGQGGTADAVVRVTVTPVNDAPVVPPRDRPIDAVGGRPLVIDGLAGASDVDGDRLTIVNATAAQGTVAIGPDGRLIYAPPLGFVGTTTISYTVADGRGGSATATILVRVADGRGADIEQLLRIGRVSFPNPSRAQIQVPFDGVVRNAFVVGLAVDDVRSLRGTAVGERPVIDAVEGARDLRAIGINDSDGGAIVAGEVARLGRLADFRDAGDRLFDQRWGDFLVKGLTGFSAAADHQACVMVESVVRGGAIYLEVRDTATDGCGAIRKVDVTPAHGARHPDWLHVDARGLAIVERGAGMDELHLVVRVTRENGRTTTTRVVVQGATGEIELERPPGRTPAHAPLHAHLHTPAETRAAAAARLAASFE